MRGVTVAIALLAFVFVCFLTFGRRLSTSWVSRPSVTRLDNQSGHLNFKPLETEDIVQWQKPAAMKIIGLVFYGRRQFVSVLDCYLKRNLAKNGGLLDEVIFVAKTDDQEDLDFLDSLLAGEPLYSSYHVNSTGLDFSQMYKSCVRGNIYIKIDDDILFIDDRTIPSMVKRKVEHPEYFAVSANIVNNFGLSWVHYHMGAVHPYLPDLAPLNGSTISWRPSELPQWIGPPEWNWTDWQAPERVRFLPVAIDQRGSNRNDLTPMATAEYAGANWISKRIGWLAVAQQHYSFFENLEKQELRRYGFDLWDSIYDRISINLIAIAGDDIVDMMPMPAADEQAIAMDWPRKTGRHVVFDGHGLATHYGYQSNSAKNNPQHRGLENTDVLDRYRLYAEENICSG